MYTVEDANVKEVLAQSLINTLVKTGMITVDVGACMGFYSIILADLVGGDTKTYAIEPFVDNVKKIHELAAKNKLSNIEVFQVAIGNENKKITFLTSKKLPWMGHCSDKKLSRKTTLKYESVEAQMVTLDHFMVENNIGNIDFLKLDIEGGEVLAVDGMSKFLGQDKLLFFMELHICFINNNKTEVPLLLDKINSYGVKPLFLFGKEEQILFPANNEELKKYVSTMEGKKIVFIFFEKNFVKCCFDLDGVICEDPTYEPGTKGYNKFLTSAKFLRNTRSPIDDIVTGRTEEYRKETEKWLADNNISYNKLIMKPNELRGIENTPKFKGNYYKDNYANLFIESSSKQAQIIGDIAKKPVCCTENNKMYLYIN